MKILKSIIEWWFRCMTQIKIMIAAAELGIDDEGWAPRYHLFCGGHMRFGYARFADRSVRWCYQCRDYWPDDNDEDDDRRGKHPQPYAPDEPDPTTRLLPEDWHESKDLIDRLRKPVKSQS